MRLLLPLLLVAAAPACSIMWDDGHKSVRAEEVAFEVGDAKHVQIHSRNGGITVVPAGGNSISGNTEFYAKAGSAEGALERVNTMSWSSTREGDTLVIALEGPADSKGNYGGWIDVAVPEGVTLELDSGNGRLNVEGDYPRMMLSTSNGRVTVKGDGTLRARTSNGRIEYTGASDDFVLDTSNGRVEVNLVGNWSGRGKIDTSNGKVIVNCSGEIGASVSMDTSNGKPHLEGPKPEGPGRLSIDTSNGSIYVRTAQGVLVETETAEEAAAKAAAAQQ